MGNLIKSDFLFASPTFASGAASVIDLWGQFPAYNESANALEADANALLADWCVVGQDIANAIGQCTDGTAV